MKKILFYALIFLASGIVTLSCSDDNDHLETFPIVGKTYNPAPLITEQPDDAFSDPVIVQRPDILIWESTNKIVTSEGQPGSNVMDVINLMLAFAPIEGADNYMDALQRSIRNISFLPDGNIQAEYVENLKEDKDDWKTSPKGIATYKVDSDSKLRLFLHLDEIKKTGLMTESGTDGVAGLILTLQDLLQNGISLTYSLDGHKLSVYLDKETLLPILKKLKPLFQNTEFCNQMKEAANSAMPGMGMFINPILDAIFRDLPSVIDGTTQLRIGLNLIEVKKE